ncbi:MAG TPA: cytochrome c biogenesis protein CcsA [Thermoanaerobaculia bacterium]|nr:cytochrome c biogenesis protein CcsA [Thermoanaerobaculia bacterium]
MERLLEAAIVLLPVAYLLVAVDYGFLFFSSRSLSPRSASLGLRAVLLLHLAYLVLLTLRWQQLPAANLSQGLSIVAFSVIAVYAIVEWMGNERSTGFWLVSIAFFFSLLSSVLAGSTPPQHELLHNPIFFGHAVLALLGYASFAVAASYGFLFLRLYRELKAGKFSLFFGKLPPLEVLERMMSGALLVGFIALTGAVVTGLVWAREVLPGQWLGDTKIVATLATWTLYAGALLLRRLRRWQGREVAIASLAGFATVLFSFFAVNLWFSDFHSFH